MPPLCRKGIQGLNLFKEKRYGGTKPPREISIVGPVSRTKGKFDRAISETSVKFRKSLGEARESLATKGESIAARFSSTKRPEYGEKSTDASSVGSLSIHGKQFIDEVFK